MDGIEEITGAIVAVIIFIIGFLFAVPSPVDLAIIVAESLKSAMPNGMATQLTEQTILGLRIFGFVLMIADVIGFLILLRRLSS